MLKESAKHKQPGGLSRAKSLYIDDNPIVGTVTAYPAGVYVYLCR